MEELCRQGKGGCVLNQEGDMPQLNWKGVGVDACPSGSRGKCASNSIGRMCENNVLPSVVG